MFHQLKCFVKADETFVVHPVHALLACSAGQGETKRAAEHAPKGKVTGEPITLGQGDVNDAGDKCSKQPTPDLGACFSSTPGSHCQWSENRRRAVVDFRGRAVC